MKHHAILILWPSFVVAGAWTSNMRAITSASLTTWSTRTMRFASLLTLLFLAGAAQAQNVDRGRLLYETHCATCHTERLHHREHSTIRSYGALRAEVGKRAAMTNRQFSPDELEDVIEFLDRSHYRLDLPLPAPKPKK